MRVFENSVLRKIFGPEKAEENCIMRSFTISTLHQILSNNKIKKYEM
jgi:hypothetical protein